MSLKPLAQKRSLADIGSMSQGADSARGIFATTHWSVVLAAGRGDIRGTSPEAQAALAELCQAYWYPIYAFLRRQRA